MSLLLPGTGGAAPSGGGRTLGTAQGAIRIDTRDAERARVTMQRVGQDIARSVQPINTALRNAQRTIREFRTEIAAIGAVGGVISAIGIRTAAGFEEATVMLTGMTGSLADAERLMANLREQAAEAGVPFADMLAATRVLLPSLEGNTAELEKWFNLVRRTAVLNQREGIAGAAFAINEALTSGGSDLVSLTERFNISRVALREALDETGGDFAAALDMVLVRMGITTETAEEMGQTFNASLRTAQDAAAQLLAAGFQPLLDNGLTPLLRSTAEWLTQLRQTRPEVANLGAAMASIAVVGAPTLLFVEQVLSSLQKIARLSPALAAIGTSLGGLALAGTAGVGLGIQGARAIGQATGREDLASANLQSLITIFTQSVAIITEQWVRVQTVTAGILAVTVDNWSEAVASMIRAAAGFVRWIADLLPGENPRFEAAAAGAERLAQRLEDAGDRASQAILDTSATQLAAIRRFAFGLAGVQLSGLTRGQRADAARYQGQADALAGRRQTGAGGRYSDEQLAAIMEFTDAIQQVEASAAQQRLDATQQYEQQRTQTIADYERQIARDAEDYARQRAREEEDLQAAIAGVRADQTEREAEQVRDHNQRLASLQEDHARRLLQIQRDYNGRIREAASGLDARSVANLQRQRDDALRDENENLRDRFDQEQLAHQERLQLARAADAQRIRDMVESLRERQRREDEDRRIRLQRQADDYRRQLQMLDSAHRSRLNQIAAQANNERRALLIDYQRRLADLGIFSRNYQTLEQQRQRQSLMLFNRYFNEIIRMQNEMLGQVRNVRTTSGGTTYIPGIPGHFQTGGYVGYTGPALVHEGEYVLNPQTTRLIETMLRSPITQPRLVGALAGGGGGASLSIGAINVTAQPGQSAPDIARAVRNEIVSLFRSL